MRFSQVVRDLSIFFFTPENMEMMKRCVAVELASRYPAIGALVATDKMSESDNHLIIPFFANVL